MADSKISDLAAVTDFLDTDEYVLARAGVSNKIAGADLRRMLKTYRKTTAKDVTNTVSETDLLNGEITIGAGVMGANGILRCSLMGDYLNSAASEVIPIFKIKFGGTTLFNDPTANNSAPVSSANRRPWICNFEIHNLGATNSQWMGGSIWFGTTAAPTTGLGGIGLASTTNGFGNVFGTSAAAAVDTTAAKLLEVTVTWGTATTTRSWRLQSAHVQVL